MTFQLYRNPNYLQMKCLFATFKNHFTAAWTFDHKGVENFLASIKFLRKIWSYLLGHFKVRFEKIFHKLVVWSLWFSIHNQSHTLKTHEPRKNESNLSKYVLHFVGVYNFTNTIILRRHQNFSQEKWGLIIVPICRNGDNPNW